MRIMSIRRALDTCVEQEGFAQFTRQFCEHLGQRSYQHAIDRVLPRMQMDSGRYTSQEVIEALETARAEIGQIDKRAHNSDVIKERLQFCNSKQDCQDYPELMASLLILQGAHQAFHTGLQEAISRNRKIPKDEKANAEYFLSLVREGFTDVGAFQFLLPLIQAENLRISSQHEGDPPHQVMRQAIGGAWKWFEEVDVLLSEETKEKAGTAAVCPANHHLGGLARNQLIEHIYAGVVAHADDPTIRTVTEKVLEQAERTEAMKMRRSEEARKVADALLEREMAERDRFGSAPIPVWPANIVGYDIPPRRATFTTCTAIFRIATGQAGSTTQSGQDAEIVAGVGCC